MAEANLKQISTGMELYFQQYGSYPPQGSDLVAELEPFVENPKAFENPMIDETSPGETLSALYVQPTLDELDSPDNYVTAMVASNGKTVLILKTGHKVVRRDDLRFIPGDLNDSLAAILNPTEGLPDGEDGKKEEDSAVRGLLNLNPRNNSDFDFVLQKSDGTAITRDDLQDSCGTLDYDGEAVWIRFCPKGNGNQNSLTYCGEPFPVRNGTLYTITSPSMSVHLYNVSCNGNGDGGARNGNGKAMGRWWIEISAEKGQITSNR